MQCCFHHRCKRRVTLLLSVQTNCVKWVSQPRNPLREVRWFLFMCQMKDLGNLTPLNLSELFCDFSARRYRCSKMHARYSWGGFTRGYEIWGKNNPANIHLSFNLFDWLLICEENKNGLQERFFFSEFTSFACPAQILVYMSPFVQCQKKHCGCFRWAWYSAVSDTSQEVHRIWKGCVPNGRH